MSSIATTFIYECNQTIRYNTKNPVPINQVIESLTGLNGLLKDVPRVIKGLTGVEIEDAQFFIQRIESGSLIDEILVKLFFKNQEEFDSFMEKIRENGKVRNTVVTLAIAGVIGYGANSLLGNKSTPNITATNNTIINIGAGEVKLTPEAFEAIVRSAVADKKDNAKNVVKFFAPSRADSQSSVFIEGVNSTMVEFPAAAIAEVPERLIIEKNELTKDLAKVIVQIRAADLDSKKAGWAGRIDGETERVKIELDPNVKEMDLFGKSHVLADATLIFAPRGKSNKLTPNKIYIRKIHQ